MKRGKKYVDSVKVYDRTKAYEVKEALKLAVETSKAKFDETIELHCRLGVDPEEGRFSCHTDQRKLLPCAEQCACCQGDRVGKADPCLCCQRSPDQLGA